jgi:hypothetical protein
MPYLSQQEGYEYLSYRTVAQAYKNLQENKKIECKGLEHVLEKEGFQRGKFESFLEFLGLMGGRKSVHPFYDASYAKSEIERLQGILLKLAEKISVPLDTVKQAAEEYHLEDFAKGMKKEKNESLRE